MASGRTGQHESFSSEQSDRRVRKTTALLREALHTLMNEKPYDEIAVKEILDRADVGRSTFYTHFRDKDDLLASSIKDIVHAARAASVPRSGKWQERILWFSLPLLEHHDRHRESSHYAMPASAKAALHAHLYDALVTIISETANADLRDSRLGRVKVPSRLIIQTIASTFVLVFDWWVDQRKIPATEANAIFRSLILPSLLAL
jgi:AcrR family transcriptional regulator